MIIQFNRSGSIVMTPANRPFLCPGIRPKAQSVQVDKFGSLTARGMTLLVSTDEKECGSILGPRVIATGQTWSHFSRGNDYISSLPLPGLR